MLTKILSTQLLPVQAGLDRWRSRRLGQGSAGIDVEIAIMRVLLAEVVARLRFGLSSGENLLQLLDQLLQVLASKISAEPKHQRCYLTHGGESLGNLAGSLYSDLDKRDFTAFFTLRQLPPRKFEPDSTQPSPSRREPRLTTPARGRKRKCQLLPRTQQNIGLNKENF